MLFLAALVLFGSVDPLDIHSGDFLDLDPAEAMNLAIEAYTEQDFHTAAAEFLNALHIDPGNQNLLYNLACCYGLLGEDELATVTLRRAFTAGFSDYRHINLDTDFDPVRNSEGFSSLIDSISEEATLREIRVGELHWFDTEESFPYRVRFPENFNPPSEVPIVIGLHGWGGTPENFLRFWDEFDNPSFIFVAPRAPFPTGHNGFSWYLGENGTEQWGHSLILARNYVIDLVEALKNEYPVSDIYLFGFSEGACLSLYSGLSSPEMFTAVIASSGWLAEDFIQSGWIADASGMEIELMHSLNDRGVPWESAVRAEAVLSENEWDVELHQTSGAHMVDIEELNLILADLGLSGN